MPEGSPKTDLKLSFIAKKTEAAANFDFNSDYGAVGEVYNMHSSSDTTSTYSITDDQLGEIDISGMFSSIAAGDYCGFSISGDTGDILVLGIRLRYT